MSGLFEKDVRLILQRKQALIIFFIIALVFGFTIEGSFIMGYLPFLAVIFAIGTISYDEFENGYAFLMTLPIDGRTYVLEKFVFCFGVGFIGWLLAGVIYLIAQTIHGTLIMNGIEIMGLTSFLMISFVITSIMIPIQLKFGLEKSRTVMMVLAGMLMVMAFVLSEMAPDSLMKFAQFLDSANQILVFGIFLIIACIAVVVSFSISCSIMRNKEF